MAKKQKVCEDVVADAAWASKELSKEQSGEWFYWKTGFFWAKMYRKSISSATRFCEGFGTTQYIPEES